MADESVLGLLGSNDLAGFNQSVVQSDPYGIAGRSLGAWQPDMSTWSPTEVGVTSFAKSFLSGLLGNYAQQNAANQLNSVISVLPQLREEPLHVATPEGVDESAFATLKANQALKYLAAKDAAVAEKKKDISTLMNSIFGEAVKNKTLSPADAVKAIQTGDYSSIMNDADAGPENIPGILTKPSSNNPLANGNQTTAQKVAAYFKTFVDQDMPASQAAIAARQQVDGELKASAKTFDEAKNAREYGQKLLDLVSTAKAGMSLAGVTGNFQGLRHAADYVMSPFSEDAAAKLQGDTLLSSIAPQLVQMSRSPGAVSDYETKLYLGSGPSTNNTPEANAILAQKLEDLGKLNLDYADFLDTYREINSSTTGAAKKWSEYRQAFPIFDPKTNELNTDRPSWQDYFNSIGGNTAPAIVADTADQDLSGYTAAQIQFMKSKGIIK